MLIILIRLVLVYMTASILLGMLPTHTQFRETPGGIEVYIVSNGVHTDFVVPNNNESIDWQNFFHGKGFGASLSDAPFIAFGWGDRGFYLNTPEWSDLTPGTAFKALFIPSASAMHVTLSNIPVEGKLTAKIRLSDEEYGMLLKYIKNSFKTGPDGKPVLINHPGYGTVDLFFESGFSFYLFRTCNVWTINGLKFAGIRSPVWTPFDKPIFYQLSKIN